MSTKKNVLSNAFAQMIGKVLTVLASLFVVKIVAGFGTDYYGNYVTAYEFLAFFGIIADAGLFSIAVREIAKGESLNKEDKASANDMIVDTDSKFRCSPECILGNVFSMRLLLVIIVTVLAGVIAQYVPSYPPIVKTGIWITGISMALTIIAGTLSAILQARMKIHYFATSLVLGKILLATLIFTVSKRIELFGDHLFFTMLWAGVVSNIVFCGLVAFFASREIRIRLKFHFDWWKHIFRKALPYGLALVLQTLYLRLDIVLISIILGSTAVGIYGISTRVLESFLVLGVFFGQAILPKLSKEEHNPVQMSNTLMWGIEKLLTFSLPIIVGCSFFSSEIIELLSSTEFLSSDGFIGSDKILFILIPTIFFAYFNQLFSFSLVASNRQNYLLKVNATALILNGVLNLMFLQKYGIIAAAISTVFCEAVVLLLLVHEIRKHLIYNFQ